jgi:uncharacterized protein DUF1579
MKAKPFTLAAIGCATLVTGLSAQQPPAPQLPKGQMPTLNRPTEASDVVPLFDFDAYFVGKWTFEWLVPESPLGPAGEIAGTTTYKAAGDGKFYEAETEAKGPAGAFRVRERIAYHKENKTMTRYVTDSRGFSYMQLAGVGGDLGGFYNINYESEPFTFKGKTIRVRDAMRLVSPVNYKVSTTIAVDGGRFTNFGNPWWQKQVAGITR